ncbi:MAG: glucose-6-phosphate dehydrogenase [Sedimentisphaerales bacterium]|nr:glucose-6-phosphate dehydrogenase [Sedimentisphaerales bacterium]
MSDISPTVTQEIICAETPAPPVAMVVFGASGDLVHRKLLPSIFELYGRELLNAGFYLIGCGRTQFTDERFRTDAADAIRETLGGVSSDVLNRFVAGLYYVCGDYNDGSFYKAVAVKMNELDRRHNIGGNRVFYLSVPPPLYGIIAEGLGNAGLACQVPGCQNVCVVVEKPFGRDLKSAVELNQVIQKHFSEHQIYRIDHYLGKETVQNIMMLRFANIIFEPVWNHNYIDNIQITVAESLGVEYRGGYYDKAGALRDMFQSHLLGMMSLVAMEPPSSFEADHIRDEKVKLLRSIRHIDPQNAITDFVRGQYIAGVVDGKPVPGYRQEPGVRHESKTETFVAAKLFIDNWRWFGVPFYLRAGKRLAVKNTEIAITFRKVPHSMFVSAGLPHLPPNVLVLQIQPKEGILLVFQAKRPGSKVCIGTLRMQFAYSDIFGSVPPEAYQRLLLDCMLGDQTLFTRQDEVEACWRLLEPVLQAWENQSTMPDEYKAGVENFPKADMLIESDGRKWRSLSAI